MSWHVKGINNRAGHVGRLKKVFAVILRPRMQELESNEPDSNPDSFMSSSASVLGPRDVTPGQVCGRWHFLCSWHFAFCNASGIPPTHLTREPLAMALGRSHLPSDNLANGMTRCGLSKGTPATPNPELCSTRT